MCICRRVCCSDVNGDRYVDLPKKRNSIKYFVF
jgi:hypothetical protein